MDTNTAIIGNAVYIFSPLKNFKRLKIKYIESRGYMDINIPVKIQQYKIK